MKEFKLSRRSKSNIKGVRKEIMILIERSIKKSEIDFGIPNYGGIRTPQEQNNLYNTKVNGKRITHLDGFNTISYHQSGEAWDIFAYFDKKAQWNYEDKKTLDSYILLDKLFKEEFDLMKEEGLFEEDEVLIWGGDWIKFKDYPHHEIRKKK